MDAVKGLRPVCLKAFLKSTDSLLTNCELRKALKSVNFGQVYAVPTYTVCSLWRFSHDLFGCVSVYYYYYHRKGNK